jgi:hypothetical protein
VRLVGLNVVRHSWIYRKRTKHGFTSLHTQDSHGNTINTKKTRFDNIEEGFHVYVSGPKTKSIFL